MKFLAMHITNQKLSFNIFTVGNLQNIFMEHDLNILMIFGVKEKCIILTQTMYCWLLLQIYHQRLKTGFVLQGHIYSSGDVDVFSDSVCWCIKAETMISSSVVANRVQQNL